MNEGQRSSWKGLFLDKHHLNRKLLFQLRLKWYRKTGKGQNVENHFVESQKKNIKSLKFEKDQNVERSERQKFEKDQNVKSLKFEKDQNIENLKRIRMSKV